MHYSPMHSHFIGILCCCCSRKTICSASLCYDSVAANRSAPAAEPSTSVPCPNDLCRALPMNLSLKSGGESRRPKKVIVFPSTSTVARHGKQLLVKGSWDTFIDDVTRSCNLPSICRSLITSDGERVESFSQIPDGCELCASIYSGVDPNARAPEPITSVPARIPDYSHVEGKARRSVTTMQRMCVDVIVHSVGDVQLPLPKVLATGHILHLLEEITRR